MSTLLQRIITAAVLLALLLSVFFLLPPVAAVILFGAFVVVAAWEWSAFVPLTGFTRRAAYSLVLLSLAAASSWAVPDRLPIQLLLWIALLWWGVAFFWVLRFPLRIGPAAGAVCGVFVIVPAWTALILLLGEPVHGQRYVLFMMAIVWAADIGAYFTGRTLGRTKLAPAVSPGKTWEGLGGGLLAAAAAGLSGYWWFGWSPWFLLPLAVSVAAVSVIGDLTVSMFKRNAGLKDSGNLFPGHGGVLDRIDSVTAAAPLFALEATWIGLLAY